MKNILYKTSRNEGKIDQHITVTSAYVTDGGIIYCNQQYPLMYCHKQPYIKGNNFGSDSLL